MLKSKNIYDIEEYLQKCAELKTVPELWTADTRM